jgi:hypothetical protein
MPEFEQFPARGLLVSLSLFPVLTGWNFFPAQEVVNKCGLFHKYICGYSPLYLWI